MFVYRARRQAGEFSVLGHLVLLSVYEAFSTRLVLRISDLTEKNVFCVSLFLSLVVQGCGGCRTRAIILILILILPRAILPRATLHLRIANQVVMDSRCRGGIVHIRGG